jgi:hypothetical protein
MLTRLLAVTVVVVLASMLLTQAQAEKRQQDQGSRDIFGRDGFQDGSAMLLRLQVVQNDLHLSDKQKGMLADMFADLADQGRDMFSNMHVLGLQNLSDEDRNRRLEEFRKKMETLGKQIDERAALILEPQQRERLNQIRLQSEGVRAFERTDVADKLGLSQAQREKIAKIQQEWQFRPDQTWLHKLQEIPKEGGHEVLAEIREEGEKFRQKEEKAKDDTLAVLSLEQKEQWEKMQGKKFAW